MMSPVRLTRASSSLALCIVLLSGCAHTPKPHYYVLSGPHGSAQNTLHQGPRIGLGPITLPDYLDRPQLVTRSSETQLVLSNEHRWAEPLSASFARALLAHLQQEMPQADIVQHPWSGALHIDRQVRLEVTRFDRGADGSFRLSVRWSVAAADAADTADSRQSDIELPVNGRADDYEAIVTAANGTLAALAKLIAAQLQASAQQAP